MLEVKKYFNHPNREYAGNDLIEVVPHITLEKMKSMLSSQPLCSPEERLHEPELQMQYITRLKRYFSPASHQADLAFMVWNAALHSLVARNPNAPSEAESFNKLCAFLNDDDASNLGPNEKLQTPTFILVMGTPGTGKSRTLEAFFTRLPTDLIYHKKTGTYQLISVTVNAPGNGRDNKTLAWIVYATLYRIAVKNGLRAPKLAATAGIGVIRQAAYDLVRMMHLGALIIDEIQHAVRGTGGLDNETMKFLTDLVNHLGIPIVLIGTWKAASLMGIELRLGRRVVTPESIRFRRMPKDEKFRGFLYDLFQFQYLPKVAELNDGYVDAFYKHTLGIQDLVVKLMMMAQLQAIRRGLDCLSLTLVDEVAKEHMDIVAPAIRMMRDGVKDDDPLLWDLEPVEFDAYFEALMASAALEVGAKRKVSMGAVAVVRKRLQSALVAADAASQKTAEVVATAAVEKHPTATPAELLVRVLTPAIAKAPKVIKTTRRTAELDRRFEELDDADVRKIAYFATRVQKTPDQALREAGYLPSVLEDLPL